MIQALVFLAMLFPSSAERVTYAGCQFDLIVKNAGPDEIEVIKISTSTRVGHIPGIYKKQWEGSQTIKTGESHTFSFTVDLCPSDKLRNTKVFYTKTGATKNYEDVGYHATGDTQEVR